MNQHRIRQHRFRKPRFGAKGALLALVLFAQFSANASTFATLLAPADRSANVSPTDVFSWTAVTGAQVYTLNLGSAPGLKDVYNSNSLSPSVTSLMVPALRPFTTYYVRLWTETGGVWAHVDSSFSTGPGGSQLLYPKNNQTSVDPFTPFSWQNYGLAQSYQLDIGSTLGASDVFSTGTTTQTSALVSGLNPNVTYHARLTTTVPGNSFFNDISFTAGPGLAHLSQPMNAAANVDPTVPFVWNSVSGAQAYILGIGTSTGSSNVYKSPSSLTTSIMVPNLIGSTVYHARLWTEIAGVWYYVDTAFTTLGAAKLISPAAGATQVDPALPFSWTTVGAAQSYKLLIGTSQGGSDAYNSGPVAATMLVPSGLRQNTAYFARIITEGSSGTQYNDSTFNTGAGSARLSSPTNQSIGFDSGGTFTWSPIPSAQAYQLAIGTGTGQSNVYLSAPSLATSLTVPGLATNSSYHARLSTEIAGAWVYTDSTFTTGYSTAHLTSPANGAPTADPNGAFTWPPLASALNYSLTVGSTPGGSDVFASGNIAGTSVSVPGLAPNTAYYARLTTSTASNSSYADSTFHTAWGTAHLLAPAPGATGVDPFGTWTWSAVPGAQSYALYIGSTPGGKDIFNSGQLASTITSRIVTGLFGGQTYYFSLFTKVNGIATSTTGSIMTAGQPTMDPAQLRNTVLSTTSAVRGMTVGVSGTPVSGTPLAQVVAEDGRTSAYCSEFARTLAQQLTSARITARVRNMTFDATGVEGHTTAEYWDSALDSWVGADATFGLVFWNPSLAQGLDVAGVAALVNSASWSTIQSYLTYATPSQAPNPKIYGNNYYMDPILLYLNPIPSYLSSSVLPLPNNPLPFITIHPASDAGGSGNWLFILPGPSQSVTIADPVKGQVTLTSITNGYTSSINLNTGWSIPSPPAGLRLARSNRYLF